MSIAADEWETLCLLIEEGWPGEFGDAARNAWRVFLDDYDAAQVLAAIKALVARGGRFRPSVADLVAEIRQDPSRPTFEEAMALIYGKGGVLRARIGPGTMFGTPAEKERAEETAMRARASELHPLVAWFVDRYGIGRLRHLELNDPEFGELRRKELREAWDRHCEAAEGRDVAALVSGRRGEIGRFDPLAALGRKAPAQIGSGQ